MEDIYSCQVKSSD